MSDLLKRRCDGSGCEGGTGSLPVCCSKPIKLIRDGADGVTDLLLAGGGLHKDLAPKRVAFERKPDGLGVCIAIPYSIFVIIGQPVQEIASLDSVISVRIQVEYMCLGLFQCCGIHTRRVNPFMITTGRSECCQIKIRASRLGGAESHLTCEST